MKLLAVLQLALLATVVLTCKSSDSHGEEAVTRGYEMETSRSQLVGGSTVMSKSDMEKPMFQEALKEVMERLNTENKCHDFNLVRVKEASQKVVSGMQYTMTIEVEPIFAGGDPEQCGAGPLEEVSGTKQAIAKVLVQAWKEPKHTVEFTNFVGLPADFNAFGEMFTKQLINPLDGLDDSWNDMSPEDRNDQSFNEAVQSGIKKLNREADKCFRYALHRIIAGKQKRADTISYAWTMDVNRIYDESMPDCVGVCADECSGKDMYFGKAYDIPLAGGEPTSLEVEHVPA